MSDQLREAARLAIDFLSHIEHTQGITLECRKGLSDALAAPEPAAMTLIDGELVACDEQCDGCGKALSDAFCPSCMLDAVPTWLNSIIADGYRTDDERYAAEILLEMVPSAIPAAPEPASDTVTLPKVVIGELQQSEESCLDARLKDAARMEAQQAEIAQLKTVLQKTKDNFEEFERNTYLAAQAKETQQDESEADAYVIDRLSKILAGIAIAFKGEELPLHRHSYHDLADLAQIKCMEIDLMKAEIARLREQRDEAEVTEMHLCEVGHLFLRPDQLYRFTVCPGCDACARANVYAPTPGAAP